MMTNYLNIQLDMQLGTLHIGDLPCNVDPLQIDCIKILIDKTMTPNLYLELNVFFFNFQFRMYRKRLMFGEVEISN